MHTLLRGKRGRRKGGWGEEGGRGGGGRGWGGGRRDNIDESTKGAVPLHVMTHLVVVRDIYGDVP